MNDRDLASRLKDVRVPERPADYWEDFPSRVRVQLRPETIRRPHRAFWPRVAWAGSLAFAILFLGLTLRPVQMILENGKTFRHQLAELPMHLKTLMADEHGMHYLIVEKE